MTLLHDNTRVMLTHLDDTSPASRSAAQSEAAVLILLPADTEILQSGPFGESE